jgi:hypothetical protein
MLAWEGDGVNIVELHSGTDASSQVLADITIGVINDYGLSLTPQKITSGATDRSDHASFWNQGYPAILGIEDFEEFNPYYHTTSDLLSAFDLPYFTDFAKAGIASVAILAGPEDVCVAIPGDANADSSLGLPDIIATVNLVFAKPGWPTDKCSSNSPLCWISDLLCRGDWDGDNNPSLSDAIRGVNYIFSKPGGPWVPIPFGTCCLPVP